MKDVFISTRSQWSSCDGNISLSDVTAATFFFGVFFVVVVLLNKINNFIICVKVLHPYYKNSSHWRNIQKKNNLPCFTLSRKT